MDFLHGTSGRRETGGLGSGREVSCPTQPRQISLRDASAQGRQETPPPLLSRQVFSLVSPSNRTTGSPAAAEASAPTHCNSPWDPPQL